MPPPFEIKTIKELALYGRMLILREFLLLEEEQTKLLRYGNYLHAVTHGPNLITGRFSKPKNTTHKLGTIINEKFAL